MSGNVLNIFFLKENKITRLFEPFTFKHSNETNEQTIITAQSLRLWSELILSPSLRRHPHLVAFSEVAAGGLSGDVTAVTEGVWGNGKSSVGAGGGVEGALRRVSLCAGARK